MLTIPMAGLVGAVMETITRIPESDVVVFLLAGAIGAAAFLARRWDTRRLQPAQA